MKTIQRYTNYQFEAKAIQTGDRLIWTGIVLTGLAMAAFPFLMLIARLH